MILLDQVRDCHARLREAFLLLLSAVRSQMRTKVILMVCGIEPQWDLMTRNTREMIENLEWCISKGKVVLGEAASSSVTEPMRVEIKILIHKIVAGQAKVRALEANVALWRSHADAFSASMGDDYTRAGIERYRFRMNMEALQFQEMILQSRKEELQRFLATSPHKFDNSDCCDEIAGTLDEAYEEALNQPTAEECFARIMAGEKCTDVLP